MIHAVVISPVLAVRAGVRALLYPAPQHGDPPIEVIAEAASLEEVDPLPEETDLLVLADDSFSTAALRQLLLPLEGQVALLVLAGDREVIRKVPGLPLRTWGVLALDSTEEELYAAVQALDQGMVVASPVFMEALLEQADLAEASIVQAGETMSGLREPLVEPLTERETQVLQYVALGLANKQIAVQLGISEHTVKFHISSIYAKLGATSRTEAVRLGVHTGLILL